MASLPVIFFQFLGLISMTKFVISLFYYIYAFFIRRSIDLRKFGSWAIVTGSTDGIGKAIAFEFAEKNLNLVLVGRSPEKLAAVCSEIKEKNKNSQVKIVVIDFLKDIEQGMELLSKEIEELDVGVLVNSAGVANMLPAYFHEEKMEVWMDMIKVNLKGSTMVTSAVLGKMLKKERGLVLNICSASTLCLPSFPLYDVYAATKAYVAQLTRCLHVEYKSKGIVVQSQFPLLVDTKMIHEARKQEWFSFAIVPTKLYVKGSVEWMGHDQECIPCLPHFLQACLLNLFPTYLLNFILLQESWAMYEVAKEEANQKAQVLGYLI